MALNPIAFSPELSIRSGGLPPTKRGCSCWAICVDGDTLMVTPEKSGCFGTWPAANLT